MNKILTIASVLLMLFGFYLYGKINNLETQLAMFKIGKEVNHFKSDNENSVVYKSTNLNFYDENDNLTTLLNENGLSIRDTNQIIETKVFHTGIFFINDSIVPYNVLLSGKGIIFIKKDLDKLELIDLIRWENLIEFSDKNKKN